ncbi:hypothetical protein QQZ08_008890 [Neonectria magnoliae]|uniref:Protein kinase domain-containing protein n=1 Tax=Neonectria magnoliae TaxID=2732573 RepID=A0ABR1HS38_9HYPO
MSNRKAAKSTCPLKSFKGTIHRAQVISDYGSRPERFLPESSISRLVTEEKVKELMPAASSDLIRFVCREARRVFLTLVYCHNDLKSLLGIVKDFRHCGLSDKRFPIDDITKDKKCVEVMEEEVEDVQCSHDTSLDAFHDWDRFDISVFYEQQWHFASPVFRESQPKQILDKHSILPFTKVNREGKGGHFSEVSEAELRADHQDKIKQGKHIVRVAIKELKNNLESGYNVERAWKREVEALDKISDLRHQHLIHRIAALKLGIKHIIVFEWADKGSLRDVWQRNPNIHKTLDGERLFCLLEQFRGLAGALCALHATNRRTKTAMVTKSNTRDRREASKVDKENGVQINITNADSPNPPNGGGDEGSDSDLGSEGSAEEKHWRHGDLKPDNILIFSGGAEWLGILKIADLGLAKQHDYATNARFEQTDTKHTTLHYEAPEVVTKKMQPRSRRYDIWSMGCIVLESMTWLLYCHDVLQMLLKQNEQVKNARDTLYFTTTSDNPPVAEVSKTCRDWIDQILKQDPECNHSMATATRDLLELVRDKLLVVALPEKNTDPSRCRADAATLKHELDRIWKNAMNKESYLFARPNRINVNPPTPSKQTGNHLAIPTARMATSQQQLNENWDFLDDNAFALGLLGHLKIESSSALTRQSSALCDRCQRLDFWAADFVIEDSLHDLELKAQACEFCQLFIDTFILERSGTSQSTTIEVRRVRSSLTTNLNDTRGLSICQNTDEGLGLSGPTEDIQIGLPKLPSIESRPFFEILRQWVQDCDTHAECSLQGSRPRPTRMPTRLIDVDKENSNRVFVCSTELWEGQPEEIVKYVALSHPWGDVKYHDHFSSTSKNIHSRIKNGIAFAELPATFKDAVKVTRELDIRYLWIDSICIIQGNDGDFKEEAKHMETVFSSAYCVIAASRAKGTSAGFLNKRPDRKVVKFEKMLGNPFYVCEDIDDFQKDVIDGPLNKRGWVLQERALARRTIYFAERQTYWECGNGVRCETLTKMTNNKAAFLGDPDFPRVATNSTKGGQIRLYESLYKQYSTLQFTKAYDRPIAIAGLEQRLIRAFGEQGGYGIFERYFGRSLLWQRDTGMDQKPMKEIEFPSQRQYRMPSWSWMAYEGGITFMDLPFSGVQWEDEDQIRSPWTANDTSSSSWHTGDSDTRIYLAGRARDFDVALADKEIVYDKLVAPAGRAMKCVVIGSQKSEVAPNVATRKHYVLVVAAKPGSDEIHERVGVGSLCGSWICLDGPCLRVHIH